MKVPRISIDYFYMSQKDQDAKTNPVIVAINEATGDKYARAAGQKGIGTDGEMEWLIRDITAELKSWGHQGGEGGRIILK